MEHAAGAWPMRAAILALLLAAGTPDAAALAECADGGPATDGRFDAFIGLEVLDEGPDGRPRLLGTTPTEDGKGIPVPGDRPWWVRPPEGGLDPAGARVLAGEIRNRGIPGLSLREVVVTPGPAAAFREVEGLRWLDLGRCVSAPDLLAAFGNCRRLERLDLSRIDLGGTGLGPLAPFPALEVLTLRRTSLSKTSLSPLARLGRLRVLDLEGTSVRGAELVHLRRLAALEILDLSGNALGMADLAPLEELPVLRDLDLSGIDFGEGDLVAIELLKTLERISLRGCRRLSGRGIARLAGLPRLRVLDLSVWDGAAVCGTCGRVAARMEGLEPAGIPVGGLVALGRIESLRELDLRGRPLSRAAVDRLRRSLPECRVRWEPPR